jgi:hypothetical protein
VGVAYNESLNDCISPRSSRACHAWRWWFHWVVSMSLLRAIITWVSLWLGLDILLYRVSEAILVQRFHLYINGDDTGV